MFPDPFRRLLAATLPACVLAVAAACPPAVAAERYQKKLIAVFGGPEDPVADSVRSAFLALKRFEDEDVRVRRCDDLYDFLDRAEAAASSDGLAARLRVDAVAPDGADKALHAAYALVPRLRIGSWHRTGSPEVKSSTDNQGVTTATTRVTFQADLNFELLVFDVAARRRIATYEGHDALTRTVEEDVRSTDPDWERRSKDVAFQADLVAAAAAQHPVLDQVRGPIDGFARNAAAWARGLEPFKLRAALGPGDVGPDGATLGLGDDLGVGLDDGYLVYRPGGQPGHPQDLREVGYVKVRSVGAATSATQAIFRDGPLLPGDVLVEHPKAHVNWTLSAGYFPLAVYGGRFTTPQGNRYTVPSTAGAPQAAMRAEFDLAGWVGVPELYGTLDLAGMTNGGLLAGDAALGLLKRNYLGRSGYYWGGELGVLGGTVQTGAVTAGTGAGAIAYDSSNVSGGTVGLTAILGYHWAFTPDWFAWGELDGSATAPNGAWGLTAHSSAANADQSFDLANGPRISGTGVGARFGLGWNF